MYQQNDKDMKKNEIKWLDTEYCGSADETVQPVIVNGRVFYCLYDKRGYQYLFATIYELHLHWSGVSQQYIFTCESEEELNKYLETEKL